MTARVSLRVLISFVVAAALAGCGGGSGNAIAPQVHPALSIASATTDRVLYVSNIQAPPGSGEVLVYPARLDAKNPAVSRTILTGTQRPMGMWVDAAGTLYVANIPDGAPTIGIKEFHPGAAAPFRTITEGLSAPGNVVVAADGRVFIDQRCADVCVEEYAPNSVNVSRTITIPITGYATTADQMAFAKNGDLLVEAQNFRTGVHVFDVDLTTFAVRDLHLAGLPGGPGLATDKAGNIYVSGEYSGSTAVYAPGATSPARSIPQGGSSLWVTPGGVLYLNTATEIEEYEPGASTPVNRFAPANTDSFGIAVGPN